MDGEVEASEKTDCDTEKHMVRLGALSTGGRPPPGGDYF